MQSTKVCIYEAITNYRMTFQVKYVASAANIHLLSLRDGINLNIREKLEIRERHARKNRNTLSSPWSTN